MTLQVQTFLRAYHAALRDYDQKLASAYRRHGELSESQEDDLWRAFLYLAQDLSKRHDLPVWMQVESSVEFQARYAMMKNRFRGLVAAFPLYQFPDEFAPANVFAFEQVDDSLRFEALMSPVTKVIRLM